MGQAEDLRARQQGLGLDFSGRKVNTTKSLSKLPTAEELLQQNDVFNKVSLGTANVNDLPNTNLINSNNFSQGYGTSSAFAPSNISQADVLSNPTAYANTDFSNVAAGQLGGDGSQVNGGSYNNYLDSYAGYVDAQTDKLNAGPGMMDYGNLGLAGVGALTSVASYFDNRKLRNKQIEGLDQQIASSKYALDRNKAFTADTNSAFRVKA